MIREMPDPGVGAQTEPSGSHDVVVLVLAFAVWLAIATVAVLLIISAHR